MDDTIKSLQELAERERKLIEEFQRSKLCADDVLSRFREADECELPPTYQQSSQREDSSDNNESESDYVRAYRILNDMFNPQSVFYPACGYDESPLSVFPYVHFLDPDEDALKGLRKKIDKMNYKGKCRITESTIEDWGGGEKYDMLILLNPQLTACYAARHVKDGGIIVANNWLSTADVLESLPRFYDKVGYVVKHVNDIYFTDTEPEGGSVILTVFRKKRWDFSD